MATLIRRDKCVDVRKVVFSWLHEDLRLWEREETPGVDSKGSIEKPCMSSTREKQLSGKSDC